MLLFGSTLTLLALVVSISISTSLAFQSTHTHTQAHTNLCKLGRLGRLSSTSTSAPTPDVNPNQRYLVDILDRELLYVTGENAQEWDKQVLSTRELEQAKGLKEDILNGAPVFVTQEPTSR